MRTVMVRTCITGSLLATILTIGCDRPASPPAVREEPAAVATITNADVPTTDSKDDYLQAVRREQLQLEAKIDDALAGIDRRLGTRPGERQALLERRSRLAADKRLIGKSDERGWDELKAEIERDLHVTAAN